MSNWYGKVFKIVAKHSGKCIDIKSDNMRDGANAHQWEWHRGDDQLFLLFPLDDGSFTIVSKNSGKALDLKGPSRSNGGNIHQWAVHGGNDQRFTLEEAGDSFYVIRNKYSGKVLDVKGNNSRNGANIHQWSDLGRDDQKFKLVHVETLPIPQKETINALGDIPRIQAFEDNLPSSTEAVLVGETFLPFYAVHDTLHAKEAVKITPYYKMKHEQYWDQKFYFEWSRYTSLEQERVCSYGMKITHRQSMEQTLGVSIKNDWGFDLFGFIKIGISSNFKNELRIVESTEVEAIEEIRVTEKRTKEAGDERCALVKYALVDRYSLWRADGTQVSTPWEVTNQNVSKEDGYPRDIVRSLISENE